MGTSHLYPSQPISLGRLPINRGRFAQVASLLVQPWRPAEAEGARCRAGLLGACFRYQSITAEDAIERLLAFADPAACNRVMVVVACHRNALLLAHLSLLLLVWGGGLGG